LIAWFCVIFLAAQLCANWFFCVGRLFFVGRATHGRGSAKWNFGVLRSAFEWRVLSVIRTLPTNFPDRRALLQTTLLRDVFAVVVPPDFSDPSYKVTMLARARPSPPLLSLGFPRRVGWLEVPALRPRWEARADATAARCPSSKGES